MALLACLGLAGCGCSEKTASKDALEIMIQGGGGGDPAKIEKVAKEKGVAYLKPLLKSEKSYERVFAIAGLGCLKGDREATQALLEVINAKSAHEAGIALCSLARQNAPETKELIERFLRYKNGNLRMAALHAIREYGDKSLYPLLDKALSDKEPAVRSTAKTVKKLLNLE